MTNKLFVAGLDYAITEDELRAHFATVGKVSYVKVVLDHATGRGKGFGFVEMESVEAAKEAMNTLNNTMLSGRSIIVKEAKPQEERPERSSRY
jgi:cold-inducible RNA-binding protein